MNNGVGLQALGMVNALGSQTDLITQRLLQGDVGRLSQRPMKTAGDTVLAGQVLEPLPQLPAHLAHFECRNHRLSYAAWLQIESVLVPLREKYGPQRVGVVLGSSTAGMDSSEAAYDVWRETGSMPESYDYRSQHAMGSVAAFVAELAGAGGPAYTISTACTSSAKAMISARGLLEAGLLDVVITGGVDTLCHLTLNGFESLGAITRTVGNPMSVNRCGLNIGEAAALFVMTRESASVQLVGGGESCDAHHMSAPHPEGLGAEASMRLALKDAGLEPDDISYLNLHGTATPQNDSMEALAVHRVFPNIPCSSTKPLTGHCLGAAGGVEAAFCWLVLNQVGPEKSLPPHVWDGGRDPEIPELNLVKSTSRLPEQSPLYVMSNSFAFGGNNCSLILKWEAGA